MQVWESTEWNSNPVFVEPNSILLVFSLKKAHFRNVQILFMDMFLQSPLKFTSYFDWSRLPLFQTPPNEGNQSADVWAAWSNLAPTRLAGSLDFFTCSTVNNNGSFTSFYQTVHCHFKSDLYEIRLDTVVDICERFSLVLSYRLYF